MLFICFLIFPDGIFLSRRLSPTSIDRCRNNYAAAQTLPESDGYPRMSEYRHIPSGSPTSPPPAIAAMRPSHTDLHRSSSTGCKIPVPSGSRPASPIPNIPSAFHSRISSSVSDNTRRPSPRSSDKDTSPAYYLTACIGIASETAQTSL